MAPGDETINSTTTYSTTTVAKDGSFSNTASGSQIFQWHAWGSGASSHYTLIADTSDAEGATTTQVGAELTTQTTGTRMRYHLNAYGSSGPDLSTGYWTLWAGGYDTSRMHGATVGASLATTNPPPRTT